MRETPPLASPAPATYLLKQLRMRALCKTALTLIQLAKLSQCFSFTLAHFCTLQVDTQDLTLPPTRTHTTHLGGGGSYLN